MVLPSPLDDRYESPRRVGSGGVSIVWQARDDAGGRVAIKVLRESLRGDVSLEARFEREGRIGAAIEHPSLPRVREHGVTDAGLPFVVLAWVDGESLAKVMERAAPLAPARACTVAVDVLGGLEALHHAGVVHRDVKPDNVLLAPDRARLLDLGIAVTEGAEALTPAGVTMGTPRWAAPEVLRGGDGRDPRVDLWSMGVVLYEMLTGRSPFERSDAASTRAAVLDASPTPMAAYALGAPEALEAIVSVALEKDPHRRFASAAAMRSALAPFSRR